MTLQWNGSEAAKALRLAAADALLRAAVELQKEHMTRLNIGNPAPHKAPGPKGEYPRKRSGFLQRNVLVVPTNRAEVAKTLVVRVGLAASAFYGVALANRGWKGLLNTLDAIRGRLQAALAAAGQARGVK